MKDFIKRIAMTGNGIVHNSEGSRDHNEEMIDWVKIMRKKSVLSH